MKLKVGVHFGTDWAQRKDISDILFLYVTQIWFVAPNQLPVPTLILVALLILIFKLSIQIL